MVFDICTPTASASRTATRRRALLLPVVAAIACVLQAQTAGDDQREYMWEVGASGGIAMAYGDLNHSRPFYAPSAAASMLWRYNANPRWSVVAEATTQGMRGDSRDFRSHYPDDAAYRFDSRLWGVDVRPEFTFWNYGWASDYREKQRIAPFLTAGIGVAVATGDGSGATVTTPLGLGARWKIAPRWNVQLTALFTRLWSDTADGLQDLTGASYSSPKGNDWTGSLQLGVTFEFKQRCVECRNQKTL